MQFTDSHIHLQDYKTKDAQQNIFCLRRLGFIRVAAMSAEFTSWDKVAEYAANYPDFVVPAFGLHPWYISEAPGNWIALLEKKMQEFSHAAIGECGLDFLKSKEDKGKQEEVFIMQTELSKKYNRPLNIHLLKAEEKMSALMPKMPAKFLLHSFSGSINFLRRALDFGAYISISAAVLRRKDSDKIISYIPSERLLLESDGPYLSDYNAIPEFAETVAAIRDEEVDEMVLRVNNNFMEFYGVK